MIGISFGEILVVIIVACLFLKPNEMQEFITKYSKIFFKVKSQVQDSIDKVKQDIAISDYSSSLNKIYQEIIKEPDPITQEIHHIDASNDDFISYDKPETSRESKPRLKTDKENYDLFFDHMPKVIKQETSQMTKSELTYFELKQKLKK